MLRKLWISALTATLAIGMVAGPVAAGDDEGRRGGRANVACLRAGVSTLIGAGLLGEVARNGLDQSFAVGTLGVGIANPRLAARVPDPIPLWIVLVDHLRYPNGAFTYPWCA